MFWLQYYSEHARRRTFHDSLVAAALRSEVSRLRDTSAALLLAQQPSFAGAQGPGPVPAFQCTATVCCVHIHIYPAPSQAVQSSSDGSVVANAAASVAGNASTGENFVGHARLLNAVFALADELATQHGVDKVRARRARLSLRFSPTSVTLG